jgi:hypothetical protein
MCKRVKQTLDAIYSERATPIVRAGLRKLFEKLGTVGFLMACK